ncbi:type II toxin-antitoxin system HicB family antitoxin [Halochromatium roseum]|uniref:type II toxin-antitoxin system HicB family antitoxin n=1 Tax=Halochromatium roseum TaxID=391920 RepID=UPI003083FCFD
MPDLPGCFSAGDSFDESLDAVLETIDLHLEGLTEDGQEIRNWPQVVYTLRVGLPSGLEQAVGERPLLANEASGADYAALMMDEVAPRLEATIASLCAQGKSS